MSLDFFVLDPAIAARAVAEGQDPERMQALARSAVLKVNKKGVPLEDDEKSAYFWCQAAAVDQAEGHGIPASVRAKAEVEGIDIAVLRTALFKRRSVGKKAMTPEEHAAYDWFSGAYDVYLESDEGMAERRGQFDTLMPSVAPVDDASFDACIRDESGPPILVYFYHDTTGKGVGYAPTVEQVAKHFGERLKAVRLSLGENKETWKRFVLSSMPTLMLFGQGHLLDVRFTRMIRDADELIAWLTPIIDNHEAGQKALADFHAKSAAKATAAQV